MGCIAAWLFEVEMWNVCMHAGLHANTNMPA